MASEPINHFTGSYFFLSNFYPVPVKFNNQTWASAEHAYQSCKTDDPTWKAYIANASSPGKAKSLARKAPRLTNWDMLKLHYMQLIIRAKFNILENASICKSLLETGERELIEGNTWGDTYWGIYLGKGENHLGKLLMERRSQLRRMIEETGEWNAPDSAPTNGMEFEYLTESGIIKRGSLSSDLGGEVIRDKSMIGWRWPKAKRS
jgi:N-glycosidase YbiA